MAKRKKYYAADGAPMTDDQAAVFGAVVDALADEHELTDSKLVTPEMIVDAARDVDSPIHDMFEWDNRKAAHKHRIQQARQFVTFVQVEIIVNDAPKKVRAYHSVVVDVDDDTVQRGYASERSVKGDAELSRQVIEKASAEARRWRARYQAYKSHFGDVFEAIDSLPKKRRGGRG